MYQNEGILFANPSELLKLRYTTSLRMSRDGGVVIACFIANHIPAINMVDAVLMGRFKPRETAQYAAFGASSCIYGPWGVYRAVFPVDE